MSQTQPTLRLIKGASTSLRKSHARYVALLIPIPLIYTLTESMLASAIADCAFGATVCACGWALGCCSAGIAVATANTNAIIWAIAATSATAATSGIATPIVVAATHSASAYGAESNANHLALG